MKDLLLEEKDKKKRNNKSQKNRKKRRTLVRGKKGSRFEKSSNLKEILGHFVFG